MQRAAQRLMTMRPEDRKEVRTKAGNVVSVPVYRVAMCYRWTVGGGPSLWKSPAGDAAEYGDVHTCGSVWHCPICAPKITTGRRDELIAAVAGWRDRGGEVYLATRTFSHDKRSRELRDSMAALQKVLSRAKGTRRALALAERAGVVGTVRALEVTHGEVNGWHPHTHELIFARPGERGRLLSHRNEWIRRLIVSELAGMKPAMSRAERASQLRYLRRHAYTVQLGDKAADYVAKYGIEPTTENGGRWGPGSELTKGHQKTGERLSGRTPFELLRLYSEGDQRAGFLFREYALAFQGRAQLYWSKGLRASFTELCEVAAAEIYYPHGAVAECLAWRARARFIGRNKSDEDLAATRGPECTEFVKRLGAEEWRLVLRTNSRFDLRMAAQLGGLAEVDALLEQLRRARATDDGNYVADWRRFDRGHWYDANAAGQGN
jgi:hypothetical protein